MRRLLQTYPGQFQAAEPPDALGADSDVVVILAALLCGGGCGLGVFDGDGGIDVAVLDGLLPLPRALQDDERAGEDAASYGYGEQAYHGEEEEEEDEEVEVECEGGGDEEVDGRAERFIERFYEEMRMQQRRLL